MTGVSSRAHLLSRTVLAVVMTGIVAILWARLRSRSSDTARSLTAPLSGSSWPC
jgi:hypothetical protein